MFHLRNRNVNIVFNSVYYKISPTFVHFTMMIMYKLSIYTFIAVRSTVKLTQSCNFQIQFKIKLSSFLHQAAGKVKYFVNEKSVKRFFFDKEHRNERIHIDK